MNESLLKNEEKAIFALRALYRSYGYLPYKMSKFEEYDLYLRNKDFLVSDRVITFNDTNGRLMALKPDVTLSIIKNGEDLPGVKQKVCYDENVYRVSGRTHQFKELLQTGLECIGDIDAYDIYEAVLLAARSLELISPDYVLDVAHLGILSALLSEISDDEGVRRQLAACIAGKNRHDAERICKEVGAAPGQTENICRFVGVYGEMKRVLRELEPLCTAPAARAALGQLRELAALLEESGLGRHVRFDFSIVNDMNYYNGVVFRGFLSGISEGVLSGGQYDKLMRRMGRRYGAVGFAIYLDLLEALEQPDRGYDVDVLVCYDGGTDVRGLAARVRELTAQGRSVSAQRAIPPRLRYRELLDLRKGGGE